MPFGLNNAPASFQRTMELVFSGISWKNVMVYIDDVVVFSRSLDEHFLHLIEVFNRLIQANIKLKLSKCHLFKSEIKYLGHIVNRSGVKPNYEKING